MARLSDAPPMQQMACALRARGLDDLSSLISRIEVAEGGGRRG
jgi:hypothetical protein